MSTTPNPTTTIPNESDFTFLLVVGGRTESGYTNEVEVVSLNPSVNPVPECLANLNDLPITVGSSGAGTVLSQGTECFSHLSRCFVLNFNTICEGLPGQ